MARCVNTAQMPNDAQQGSVRAPATPKLLSLPYDYFFPHQSECSRLDPIILTKEEEPTVNPFVPPVWCAQNMSAASFPATQVVALLTSAEPLFVVNIAEYPIAAGVDGHAWANSPDIKLLVRLALIQGGGALPLTAKWSYNQSLSFEYEASTTSIIASQSPSSSITSDSSSLDLEQWADKAIALSRYDALEGVDSADSAQVAEASLLNAKQGTYPRPLAPDRVG